MPAGNNTAAVVVADFDGDGAPDVVVANEDSNDLSVFLGTGTGALGAPTTISLGAGNLPRALVAADLDGDGRQDLAVANFGSGSVRILGGNGDGTFVLGPTLAVGANPQGIAARRPRRRLEARPRDGRQRRGPGLRDPPERGRRLPAGRVLPGRSQPDCGRASRSRGRRRKAGDRGDHGSGIGRPYPEPAEQRRIGCVLSAQPAPHAQLSAGHHTDRRRLGRARRPGRAVPQRRRRRDPGQPAARSPAARGGPARGRRRPAARGGGGRLRRRRGPGRGRGQQRRTTASRCCAETASEA